MAGNFTISVPLTESLKTEYDINRKISSLRDSTAVLGNIRFWFWVTQHKTNSINANPNKVLGACTGATCFNI